jgi:glutaredoxin
MADLKVYTNRAVRSAVAKKFLQDLGIAFDEINVDENPEAVTFLESNDRNLRQHPCPQFYVNNQLAWANGFKDIAHLTPVEINQRIEELNA